MSLGSMAEALTSLTTSGFSGNVPLLSGFLLALLATFALAAVHGEHAWRNVSIFANGMAMAAGIGLLLAELELIATQPGNLALLRVGMGLFAAVAVAALWPAVPGLATRAETNRKTPGDADCRSLLEDSTHRIKNLLATIQSVARMSGRAIGLAPVAAESFNARIQAIALAYDLLVRENWTSVPLGDLVQSQLNHALGKAAARAGCSGPLLHLQPSAAQTLALALHELAARARTRGAMATPAGSLHINWEETALRDGTRGYRLVWQEIGSASAPQPELDTFAPEILERLTPRGLRGEASASQTGEGFRWELRFPASNVVTADRA